MSTISVQPSRLNFSVRKGATLRRSITWYSDPVWKDRNETELDTALSTPVDLTGYTARMQVRDKASGNTIVFELTTANGGLTLGDAAGTIEFYLSDSATDNPAADDCEYDLELIAPNSDVIPFLAGSFLLADQITV